MIPTRDQCAFLFGKYKLPSVKRIHVEKVAKVALYLASKLEVQGIFTNTLLIEAAALLHDIDKAIPKKEGERHPDTAVRVLLELGFAEVAEIVKKHSVHCILDSKLTPTTWEEKIVFLADKMVKHEFIGVEARFRLWYSENLPEAAVAELKSAYPKVLRLEQEIFSIGHLSFEKMRQDVKVL